MKAYYGVRGRSAHNDGWAIFGFNPTGAVDDSGHGIMAFVTSDDSTGINGQGFLFANANGGGSYWSDLFYMEDGWGYQLHQIPNFAVIGTDATGKLVDAGATLLVVEEESFPWAFREPYVAPANVAVFAEFRGRDRVLEQVVTPEGEAATVWINGVVTALPIFVAHDDKLQVAYHPVSSLWGHVPVSGTRSYLQGFGGFPHVVGAPWPAGIRSDASALNVLPWIQLRWSGPRTESP